jgi:hypothetical protein
VQTVQGSIVENFRFPRPSNLLQTILLPSLADVCVLKVVRHGELNPIGLDICRQYAFSATYSAFVELYPLYILSFQDEEYTESRFTSVTQALHS